MSLLQVENLHTEYTTQRGIVSALEAVSLRVQKEKNFGLVGESGCGKTTLLKSIISVLPQNAKIVKGKIIYQNMDLVQSDEETIRQLRWKEISMITQSALNALDPVYQVGKQIIEGIQTHEDIPFNEAKERIEEMFVLVGIDKERFNEFPHQFSGGMRQRAIIAMALILNPSLVIADEPTTSLDVIVQDQIFRNIRSLQEKLGFSLFLVTHDIAVVVENCDEIGVMYGGKMVEMGSVHDVVLKSYHPYTMGLKNAFPDIANQDAELISIPGFPPTLLGQQNGCRFYERCPFATEQCQRVVPEFKKVSKGHFAACHYTDKADWMRNKAGSPEAWQSTIAAKEN